MRPLCATLVVSVVVGLSACEGDPGADLRSHRPVTEPATDGGEGAVTGGATVAFEPPATETGVARVVRVRLTAPSDASAEGAILVDGNLSASQLRDIARGVVSQTVAARRVDLLAWLDPADPRTVVAQPVRPLTAGHAYTLAVRAPSVTASFVVAAGQPLAMLRRVWPIPRDATASPRFAVFCGASPVALATHAALFEPGAVAGRFAPGIDSDVEAAACVRWSADDGAPLAPPIVPPPALELDDGTVVLLDPSPLDGTASAPQLTAEPCAPDEVALGLVCLAVEDDRVVVRPGAATALVALRAGAVEHVAVPRFGERFVVRPLEPGASVEVRAAVADAVGRVIEDAAAVTTSAARARVVIDEVYANPIGPEPAQEWVELVNDGLVAAQLGGMTLEDVGGAALLPDAVLEPGGYAVVVAEAFSPDDAEDLPPASGALVVRVPKLGKSGLSNEGEPVVLRDAQGNVVSRFPASPKPKQGVSVIRIAPGALDENASSFALDPNGSATPGAPNPPVPTL